jgi:hypothetical protein
MPRARTKAQQKLRAPDTLLATSGIMRGVIRDIYRNGDLLVALGDTELVCDFLETGANSMLKLRTGDQVLVLPPAQAQERACVLGRIGAYREPDTERVTVSAERELTLECGEASITLRHDGKVLTRALDIAAVAKRRHRIKGGSVEIN